MRKQILLIILLSYLNTSGQITILNADMPRVNDTLRYSNAENNLLPLTFEATGANFTWNFANLKVQSQ
ncbi:MAG: hypothetical protein Q8R57_08665, partial [Bacteroidota bacterium]|nr:hypothetical protein [Bacteroidota bacterium]